MMDIRPHRAIVVIVVPKTLDQVPMRDIYSARQKRRWAFAIVHPYCEAEFRRRYGKLPWDRVWVEDFSDPDVLERLIAEVQAEAEKPYPIQREESPRPLVWPERDEEKREKREKPQRTWWRKPTQARTRWAKHVPQWAEELREAARRFSSD